MKNIYVRFETGMFDRISKEYGPFEFVQITYGTLRVSTPDDVANEFAYYNEQDNEWWITDPKYCARNGMAVVGDPEDAKQWWSDIIIYSKP